MVKFLPRLAMLVLWFPAALAEAANDWTQPCHYGECNWDLSSEIRSAAVRVTGSRSGISDLTDAAGWTVLDCDPSTPAQEIRAVCHDPTLGCDHLYENGAEQTLVRLPDACGPIPFALVVREWHHEDQDIPASHLKRVMRRDGTLPPVRGIRLSTDFRSGDPSRHGNIVFYVQASTVPGLFSDFAIAPPSGDSLSKREWVTGTSLHLDALHASAAISPRRSFETRAELHTITGAIHPFNFTTPALSLFNESFGCPSTGSNPAYSGQVNVGLAGGVNGSVDFGFAYVISIPEEDYQFALSAFFNSSIDVKLSLDASLKGSLTAEHTLFGPVGLPGLGIEGLIEVGPIFSVDARATAEIDISLHTSVDLAYNIANGHLIFPPIKDESSDTSTAATQASNGSFAPSDTGLHLSVDPLNANIHGRLEAHLVPTLAFGIDALLGSVKATINLELDASATLDLSINNTITSGFNSSEPVEDAWDGCVDIETGLSVDAGADADFLSLFDENTEVPLFGKTFQLFKKCFGGSSAGSRRDVGARRVQRREQLAPRNGWRSALPIDEWAQGSKLMKAVGGRVLAAASTGSGGSGFTCPAAPGGELTSLADQIVPGSSLV